MQKKLKNSHSPQQTIQNTRKLLYVPYEFATLGCSFGHKLDAPRFASFCSYRWFVGGCGIYRPLGSSVTNTPCYLSGLAAYFHCNRAPLAFCSTWLGAWGASGAGA